MANPIDTHPPMRNEAIAAMNAHRKRSRPWPKGCVMSAGTPPRSSDMPRNTSFNESASEWPASASRATEPDSKPAASFAAARTRLATSAKVMVREVSPPTSAYEVVQKESLQSEVLLGILQALTHFYEVVRRP